MKTKYWIGILLLTIVASFFIGRSTIDEKEKIKYVEGETITGSVDEKDIELISEESVPNSELVAKTDTIIEERYIYGENRTVHDTIFITEYVLQEIDTLDIVEDYHKKRTYQSTLFDNKEQGKLIVFPTVYQNRLTSIDYRFTPIHREITNYKIRVWQPFVSGSYSTLDYFGLGGGVFYHNLGFEYQYNIDIRSKPMILQPVDKYFERGNYHWFSGKYKF